MMAALKTTFHHKRHLLSQLFRFGLVGGAATLVNSVVFILLVDKLKLAPLLGNFLAFVVAFFVSYFGHSWWTFKHKQHSHEKLMKFLVTSLVSLGLNSLFVWTFMHLLHQSAYIATLPMIFITPLLTFAISKYWVFKHHSAG
jgi:putative flippase GtrA